MNLASDGRTIHWAEDTSHPPTHSSMKNNSHDNDGDDNENAKK